MAIDKNNPDIDVMEPEEKEFSIFGGAFFKANPEKMLAEEYEASGLHGMVKKYRPKPGMSAIEALNIIETPVFIGHGITDRSVGTSVIRKPKEGKSPVVAPDQEAIVRENIENTEKAIIKKQRSEKRKLKDFEEPSSKPTLPFEDVLRIYNPDLSMDEIKAFLWYMHQQGNPYRGKWLSVFNPMSLSQEQEAAFIQNWVRQGILFYYDGDLLPAFAYFSESIYERKEKLEDDKHTIIKLYGQEAYEAQEKRFNEVWAESYSSRLKLDDPDLQRRLHLKPYGEFSSKIMIKNWKLDSSTGEPENFYLIISGSAKTAGEIAWYSAVTHVSSWKGKGMEELSIADAFRYWLKHDDNRPRLPYSYNWEDIFKYYLDKKAVKNMEPTVLARHRALTKDIGEKLFSKFLAEVILENDRVKIERIWNEQFNGNRPLKTSKIPIAFECALNYPGDNPVEIRPEKREAVAFASIRGSSLNAYQVGVGKTWAAILTIAQFLDAGHCKRPFLIVPNAVYKQFYAEIKGILPHKKINDLYNLSKSYADKLRDENGNVQMVDEGSISILTYEGFERIGFNETTSANLIDQLSEALLQIEDMESKKGVKSGEKLAGIVGRALQKTETNIEDLGFDFVCFDEAHALKNIFAQVKARTPKNEDGEAKQAKGRKMYEIQGSTSTRGIKGYCLCSYIQLNNKGRNVMLLTATPFTNSPLEVYSMLSLVAYQYLRTINLSNINSFFDNYCQMSYELVIDAKLKPVRKQIFKAFDNLLSLQKLIYSYMLHKEAGKPDQNGETIPANRPDKWVLPYTGRFNDKNEYIAAGPDEFVETSLSLTNEQKLMMDDIILYAEGEMSYDKLSARGMNIIEEDEEGSGEDSEVFEMEEEFMLDTEKAGVRILRSVNFSRSLALSPYLFEFSGLGEPDYKNYIEKSPKLKYVMDCVASVKKWHEDNGTPISGQVIYMDRGKKYFELIKDYLVKVIGYKPHEIGIIRSGEGKDNKDYVKNKFYGAEFDEASKTFVDIDDSERMKIVIGTSSIREGMNLQRYSTVLFNCFVDWNPTDEIQLEGRIWRQGNNFKNVRIVIPMMADSMDIFMFEKLKQKTERINSIWNYDGNSNVLKIEELDPKELQQKLITNPRIIAELEVEGKIAKMDEEIANIDSNIETAGNIRQFYETRDRFEKKLMQVLEIVEPDKAYSSIDVMIKDFETMLVSGKNSKDEECETIINRKLSNYEQYRIDFINYGKLYKEYSFGHGKAAVAMLKKAKKSFLEKNNIEDNSLAVQDYIDQEVKAKQRIEEDKGRLTGEEYISNRASQIERERKQRKIEFASVADRVTEFEKLNFLLGLVNDKNVKDAASFIWEDIEGCPTGNESTDRDISPEGIKQLEACLEKLPQTKNLHLDANGEYTEARKKRHAVIKAKLRAGNVCKVVHEQPIAIFTGGVPGSGKSHFLKQYAPGLLDERIFKIDADEIRTQLPEYKGWNASATHEETQDIYKSLLKDIGEGKPCKFDILWDGTMNKADNYKPLIGSLKSLGYKIYMIYVSVPWAKSRQRVLDRYKRSGRYVPMQVVDEANERGLTGFEELKNKADGYMLVNGETAEIIEKGGNDILAGRGYFETKASPETDEAERIRILAVAQAQRIRIILMLNKIKPKQ